MTESVLVYFVAVIALFVNKCETNRAAIFLYATFFSAALLISLDDGANFFLWSIISTTAFMVALSMLSRATKLVFLLAMLDIILASIDLIALVAYNLNVECIYQYRESSTFYVGIAQLTCLLVTDARSVNISSIRYNLSMLLNHASRFFVRSKKVYSREK